MKKEISKTAVFVSGLAGATYGIYHHNLWLAAAGFFVVGAVVYCLERLFVLKCKCDKHCKS